MVQTPTINIGVRRDRGKDGRLPLYIYFTIHRKVSKISLGKMIPENTWVGGKAKWIREKGKNGHPNGSALNFWLNQQVAKAEKIILEAERDDILLNFTNFKKIFQRGNLGDFFEVHNDLVELKKMKGNPAEETLRKYQVRCNNLKAYKNKVNVREIDLKWIREYENYMYREKSNASGTIYKNLIYVRAVLDEALRQRIIKINPFDAYNLSYVSKEMPALTEEDVKRLDTLYHAQVISAHLQRVLHYFLFSCYTGLDYGDTSDLDYSDFKKIEDVWWIMRNRCKRVSNKPIGNPYAVPVQEKALKLINITQNSGKVFSVISNQKYNEYIKIVVNQILGIKTHATTHTARRTFASVLANNGVPMEIIGKYLGQEEIRTTSGYVKYTLDTLLNNFKYEKGN